MFIDYRDSSPNTHFGTRKRSCQAKSHCWMTLGLYYAKTQKKRAGARNHTSNYSVDANFLVPKPKPHCGAKSMLDETL